MKDKNTLRKEIRAEKKSRTAGELHQQSVNILQQLSVHPQFVKAKTVMLYASLPDEVETLEFIEQWRTNKNIILPVVEGDDIIPTALEKNIEMKNGEFNILEPQNQAYKGSFDLIVVPGMAFDRQGHRLGRGKGFYDRFLSNYSNVYKIGLCFDFQLVEDVPNENHDQVMNEIISYKI